MDPLLRIVSPAESILFDFDGPICSVFAGSPAPAIARHLLRIASDHSGGDKWGQFETDDPLEVLRLAARLDATVLCRVEDALREAERAAVRSAVPTPGGAQSIRSCVESGRLAAVVSNNSAEAIWDYLAEHDLAHFVGVVIGRPPGCPSRMKPSSSPINQALTELGVSASSALMIGDSVTDIEASRRAGTACIGFVNKPVKWSNLIGADVLIDDMGNLADALSATAGNTPAQRS